MYGYPLDQQQLNEELHHVPQKETNKREHSSTTAYV